MYTYNNSSKQICQLFYPKLMPFKIQKILGLNHFYPPQINKYVTRDYTLITYLLTNPVSPSGVFYHNTPLGGRNNVVNCPIIWLLE